MAKVWTLEAILAFEEDDDIVQLRVNAERLKNLEVAQICDQAISIRGIGHKKVRAQRRSDSLRLRESEIAAGLGVQSRHLMDWV